MNPSRILDLLMTTFSGTKDEFGKEDVPPLPFSFDRVNEGRAILSDSKLLSLLAEVLGDLVQYLTSESLEFSCIGESRLSSTGSLMSICQRQARLQRFQHLSNHEAYGGSSAAPSEQLIYSFAINWSLHQTSYGGS